MSQSKKLIIAAGGTGGHVYPGLEVARYLIDQGWRVRWLGTKDRIEANLVKKYNIEIDFIRIFGLRGKSARELLVAPMHIFNACRQARIFIKQFKPNVLLGMGGYVSGPGSLAAWSLGIPIVLHEQNNTVGLTNKWLAKIANKVTQAFPNTFPNTRIVGNPIRKDILALSHPEIRLQDREGPIRVLVVGGSQGAKILNQIMPKVAEKLGNRVIFWHQSGEKLQENVKQMYCDSWRHHKVSKFIDDMAAAYNWADIVVCRSGALTVSEIAAVGLPAIFVPFQHKDRHQYWNALPLEKAGAAKIFEQSQFTVDAVAATVSSWNRKVLLEMAKRARTMAVLDSTEKIAKEVSLVAHDIKM